MRYLLLLFFMSIQLLYAQQSFELKLGDNTAYEWLEGSKEHQGSYYAFGLRYVPGNSSAYINRISPEGEVLQTEWYPKTDTANYLSYILPKENGNLLCIGGIVRVVSKGYSNDLYFREITPDLELVREKYDSLPATNSNTNFTLANFLITPMNEIILQGVVDTAIEGYTNFPFFAKYDFEGNRLSHKIYYQYRESSVGSELLYNLDSTAFYLIGDLSLPSAYDWAKFDLEFNYLGCGNFPTNESAFTNPPLSVKRLQDGNFIMAHKVRKVGNTYVDGLEMRLYNPNFELLDNVLIYDEDEVNIPMIRGMSFIDEDHIWVANFESEAYHEPTDLRFYVFDAGLNLKGSKVFKGDRSYWLLDLLATSDGGCLISGKCDEKPASNFGDGFIKKVILSDIVTGSSEQMAIGKEVRIGPVPATDKLTVQTRSDDCTLLLSNMEGRVLSKHRLRKGVNLVGIQQLPSGLYIATVINNKNNHVENFKIIKQ